MRPEPPRRARHWLPLGLPTAALAIFFVVPLATMVAVSFYQRDPLAFYRPDFVLENYARFLTPFFGGVLSFSIGLAMLVAALATAVAFPFTWLLTGTARRVQAVWLVAVLAVLSLSEVIIGFAWSTLLSRTAGLGNLLAWIGLIPESRAYTPSFGAVAVAMTYQVLPFAVLVLYPPLVRFDRSLVEAARTMGATPFRAFRDVVVPGCRGAILATLIMSFVFALGAYLLPQILGRPQHWTLSVHITDQAVFQSNLPFAAAMAVLLALMALALIAVTLRLGGRRAP